MLPVNSGTEPMVPLASPVKLALKLLVNVEFAEATVMPTSWPANIENSVPPVGMAMKS